MRAIVLTAFGGPEVLELQDVPSPEPGAGEVLVDVAVAGVNFRDIYECRGGYAQGAQPSEVVGVEGMGRVAVLGEGVTGVAVGDRVAWNHTQGSYAEQIVVPAPRAVPVPDGISDELACAALLQGMTAHYLTNSTYPVQPGDEVLVHAAAGGAGRLTLQMAKMRGGRVTATTSGGEKAELARAGGADEVIGYERRSRWPLRGRLRRCRRHDLRPQPQFAEAARNAGAVRRGERPRAAGRGRPPERRLDVPDPADARPLRRHARGSALALGRRVRVDRRRVARRPDRRRTHSPRRGRRRRISSRAGRRGSSC